MYDTCTSIYVDTCTSIYVDTSTYIVEGDIYMQLKEILMTTFIAKTY